MKNYIHVSKNGTKTPLKELDEVHLDNIIKKIEREANAGIMDGNKYKEMLNYHLYTMEKARREYLPV